MVVPPARGPDGGVRFAMVGPRDCPSAMMGFSSASEQHARKMAAVTAATQRARKQMEPRMSRPQGASCCRSFLVTLIPNLRSYTIGDTARSLLEAPGVA